MEFIFPNSKYLNEKIIKLKKVLKPQKPSTIIQSKISSAPITSRTDMRMKSDESWKARGHNRRNSEGW